MADDIILTISIETTGTDEAVSAFQEVGDAADELSKQLETIGGLDFSGIYCGAFKKAKAHISKF
jgi:hypothetical protein